MSLDKLEIWVHDHILKNAAVRHFVYGAYQRFLYLISPKFKFEGNITRITPNDGYEYLFGYYDKCPWSPSGRYMLSLRVKNATKKADSIELADIVTIDLQNNNQVTVIASTHCWNVQQGCMAQWLDENTILYNDFRNGSYCAVILNLETKTEKIISKPVYTVSNDRKIALTLDFSRLHRLRPGYGYANIPEATEKEKCPDEPCVWKIDLENGEIVPLLNYTDFANFDPRPEMEGAEHKVNHLMISPNGKRFMVLHRWFQNKVKYTRLITCNIDGTDMYNLSDDDFVSHCCWKNDEEIISYLNKAKSGKGYYLMKDHTLEYTRLWPQLAMDGHPTCSYDGQYVVTDTYPNRRRIQAIYAMANHRVKRIARVFSPFRFGGDTRCDLHPRWSRDGKQICFDGSFEGRRQVYVVDFDESVFKKQTVGEYQDPPKVSVVIPCYNCEKLIDETLESLENQTYRNFEVICVNDGSTDGTLELLKKWQSKENFCLRIIDQPNGGVSSARNKGISECRGEYIVFCDSDDLYHENYIELLVNAIESSDADAAYCVLSRNRDDVMSYEPAQGYKPESKTEAMNRLLYQMGNVGFYCYIYKKELLEKEQILFDIETKFGEDREFNWKYLCHCQKVAFVDAPLYWYRVNQESATQKKASWRKTDLLTAVKRIEAYLEEHHCEFSAEFNSYMYARAMWAVAKTFAFSGDKALYSRLRKEYDVRTCMKRTAKDESKLVAIASRLYLIHPNLFYWAIGLKK